MDLKGIIELHNESREASLQKKIIDIYPPPIGSYVVYG